MKCKNEGCSNEAFAGECSECRNARLPLLEPEPAPTVTIWDVLAGDRNPAAYAFPFLNGKPVGPPCVFTPEGILGRDDENTREHRIGYILCDLMAIDQKLPTPAEWRLYIVREAPLTNANKLAIEKLKAAANLIDVNLSTIRTVWTRALYPAE